MFGKIAAIVSYLKNLEVYLIKRFPSTKVSVPGMMLTYLATFYLISRWSLIHRTNNLRSIRQNKNTNESNCPFPGLWSFNKNYVYNPNGTSSSSGKSCPF
jgi:hypothetical protein